MDGGDRQLRRRQGDRRRDGPVSIQPEEQCTPADRVDRDHRGRHSCGPQSPALGLFAVLGSVTILAPVTINFALGTRATEVLDGREAWLGVHNPATMTVLLLVLGARRSEALWAGRALPRPVRGWAPSLPRPHPLGVRRGALEAFILLINASVA
jgi:hypothetical protein